MKMRTTRDRASSVVCTDRKQGLPQSSSPQNQRNMRLGFAPLKRRMTGTLGVYCRKCGMTTGFKRVSLNFENPAGSSPGDSWPLHAQISASRPSAYALYYSHCYCRVVPDHLLMIRLR